MTAATITAATTRAQQHSDREQLLPKPRGSSDPDRSVNGTQNVMPHGSEAINRG